MSNADSNGWWMVENNLCNLNINCRMIVYNTLYTGASWIFKMDVETSLKTKLLFHVYFSHFSIFICSPPKCIILNWWSCFAIFSSRGPRLLFVAYLVGRNIIIWNVYYTPLKKIVTVSNVFMSNVFMYTRIHDLE